MSLPPEVAEEVERLQASMLELAAQLGEKAAILEDGKNLREVFQDKVAKVEGGLEDAQRNLEQAVVSVPESVDRNNVSDKGKF